MPYVAALPVPTLDRKGHRLAKNRRDKAVKKVLKRFDELFGGAKVVPSPATYRTLSGITLVEEREPLVLSMTTRKTYAKHRKTVEQLAVEVGEDLNQESMVVIAFDSGKGVLLFMEQDSA